MRESHPIIEKRAPVLPAPFSDTRYDLAHDYSDQNSNDASLDTLRSITKDLGGSFLRDALKLEQKKKSIAAVEALKKCVTADPTRISAWKKLALMQDGVAAETACRKYLAADPDNQVITIRLTKLLVSEGKQKEALEVLVGYPKPLDDVYEYQETLASISWTLGNFEIAEKSLLNCLRLKPDQYRPLEILTELLDRVERVEEILELSKAFLIQKPKDIAAKEIMAIAMIRLKNWPEAEKLLQELLQESPKDLKFRWAYTDMLIGRDRKKEALEFHQETLKLDPSNAKMWLNWIDLLHSVGEKSAAQTSCDEFRKLYLNSPSYEMENLPHEVNSRVLFHHLHDVRKKFCTGYRSLTDQTGLTKESNFHQPGDIVELFCMVIGNEHIEYLVEAAYPSLFASPGFDEMQKKRKVICNIYTTPGDLGELNSFFELLHNHSIEYRVNVELLSFNPDFYSILVLPVMDQIQRAINHKSVVVMALPDAIINGSIAHVIDDMQPDETVVCAMPRIDAELAFKDISKHFAVGGKALKSRDFVFECMTTYEHPQTYSALHSENKFLKYSDRGNYYQANNFCPPPLCFYARPEMLTLMEENPMCGPTSMNSFFTIDHDIVHSAWKNNCLRLIPNSDYFFWAELTGPKSHVNFLAGRKSENYYYPDSACAIFEHDFKWIYKD